MRSIALLTAALCLPCLARADLPSGIAAGDVTQNSAVLWARSDTVGAIRFDVSTEAAFGSLVGSYTVSVGDVAQPAKLGLGGLAAGQQYYYRATDAAGGALAGSFRTAAAGGFSGLRFGVTGDWRGDVMPFPAIKNVPGRNLDFMVLLGDTMYADIASPALATDAQTLTDFRAKHAEVLSSTGGLNAWAAARASTAVYAMIDDHEVTNDFAGGAHPSTDARFDNTGSFINETQLYQNGLQAFHEYMPIESRTWSGTGEARFDGKPDLYRSQRFGNDAALYLLDARSFRDPALPEVTNPLDPGQVGPFLVNSFDPSRTLLGQAQKDRLKTDLLAAQADGVTWKLVMVPEPMQNLSPLAAQDRFEGYAAERTELLKFITDNGIDNVVFVAADVHGSVVNNLTFQEAAFGEQIPTAAWEISTGSVAFDAPLAQTVMFAAQSLGLIDAATFSAFLAADVATQDLMFQGVLDSVLAAGGYDPSGLDGSGIAATLLQGSYVTASTYGWSEFEIDPLTQGLTVSTWGVPYFPAGFAAANPALVAGLEPALLSRFVVSAVPEVETWAMLLGGLGLASLVARRRAVGLARFDS